MLCPIPRSHGYHERTSGGFLLLRNFSVAISVSPHVCFILVLIQISMFLGWLVGCFGLTAL